MWLAAAMLGAIIGAGIGLAFPAQWLPEGQQTTSAMLVGLDGVRTPFQASHPQTVSDSTVADPNAPDAARHADPKPEKQRPDIPPALVAPFVLLLGAIAVMPLAAPGLWHRRYPEFAFALGSMVMAYYLAAFGAYGRYQAWHVAVEYYQFIGIVIGLYFVSGAIVINVRARGRPLANTLLLAFGAVIANFVGTTGASMLLIRPFMRINEGRLRPIHIVFFIFIVSNCGGALTPIGDPPLYLGFIKGVPFFWTLSNLWQEWLFVCGSLLIVFFAFDTAIERRAVRAAAPPPPRQPGQSIIAVEGAVGIVGMALVVAAVFIDPMLRSRFRYEGLPIGPAVQIAVAIAVTALADRSLYTRNRFSIEPAKEVACLFVGIFATMAPALAFLSQHGARLGLESPTQYFFLTGALSAALDNAPTYLSFLQLAFSALGADINQASISLFIASTFAVPSGGGEIIMHGASTLAAVSLGAVFFGAATYIGNGPNFMVKAIAESAGVRMPSFLGFVRWSGIILLPVLVGAWWLFIRA